MKLRYIAAVFAAAALSGQATNAVAADAGKPPKAVVYDVACRFALTPPLYAQVDRARQAHDSAARAKILDDAFQSFFLIIAFNSKAMSDGASMATIEDLVRAYKKAHLEPSPKDLQQCKVDGLAFLMSVKPDIYVKIRDLSENKFTGMVKEQGLSVPDGFFDDYREQPKR